MVHVGVGIWTLALGQAWFGIHPPTIETSFQGLIATDFVTRERASRELLAYGPRGLPRLQALSQASDPETAERARLLAQMLEAKVRYEELIRPRQWPVRFEQAGLNASLVQLDRLVGTPILADPRILPSRETLSLSGVHDYWQIVQAIENRFALRYEERDGQPLWMPATTNSEARPEPRSQQNLGGFRWLAERVPVADQDGFISLLLTLQADPARQVLRVEDLKLEIPLGEHGPGWELRGPFFSAPLVDPVQMRVVRGGRFGFGRNGLEATPGGGAEFPTLQRNQVGFQLRWPDTTPPPTEFEGVASVRVRGQAQVLCQIDDLSTTRQATGPQRVALKVAPPQSEPDGATRWTVNITYQPYDWNFPALPHLRLEETDTAIINGRARWIVRGPNGVLQNGNRYGLTERLAYHGVEFRSPSDRVVAGELVHSSVNVAVDGLIIEEFQIRLTREDREASGDPDRIRLLAAPTRTIRLPFQLPWPESARRGNFDR